MVRILGNPHHCLMQTIENELPVLLVIFVIDVDLPDQTDTVAWRQIVESDCNDIKDAVLAGAYRFIVADQFFQQFDDNGQVLVLNRINVVLLHNLH